MKRIAAFVVLLLCLMTPCMAAEDVPTENAQDTLAGWQEKANDTPLSFEELQALTVPDILSYFWQQLCAQAQQPLRCFVRLVALLFLAAIVHGGYQPQVFRANAQLYEMAVVAAVVTLLYHDLFLCFSGMEKIMEESRVLLSGFVPVFSSVMVACGQGGVATACNGFFLSACMLLAGVIGSACQPILRMMMALHIAGGIGSGIDMSAIATYGGNLLRRLLSIASIIFCAIWGIQNVLATSADNAALQAGKALLGSSIPVVGKAISEAFVGVLSGMKALQGGIAFALLASLGATFLPVLLQCASMHFFLFCGSIVAEGCSLQGCKKILRGFADCAQLACFLLLFFFLLVTVSVLLMLLTSSHMG